MAGVLKQGIKLARKYFTFDGWVSGENSLQKVWFGVEWCDVLREKTTNGSDCKPDNKLTLFRRET